MESEQLSFDFDARLTADEQSILNELLSRLEARDERKRRGR